MADLQYTIRILALENRDLLEDASRDMYLSLVYGVSLNKPQLLVAGSIGDLTFANVNLNIIKATVCHSKNLGQEFAVKTCFDMVADRHYVKC